ncbi:MAG TPA: UDP-3-O-acyl-N-acetylglucosamine deacetylase [Rickettsiales bacterium]|nr:UDP-3-O-acyl-N-acetylglucosamine deacetylase [Rickettsiales bacterium]
MYTGNQTTILNEVSFFGKPKNKKKIVNVKILPAEANKGIIFKRTDLKKDNIIELNYNNAFIENNELVIKNNKNVSVSNVELLLDSIWANRLDNLLIELDGDAIPYIDGTSEPISFLLTIGRAKELENVRNVFVLEQDNGIKIGKCEISIKPSNSFIIEMKNGKKTFLFDNKDLPFKDWLSNIKDNSKEKNKLDVISALAIIFISGKYCKFEVKFKNFDKQIACEFFKNILK